MNKKTLFASLLILLFVTGCVSGKYHDSQIHKKCNKGANKISIGKHLDCQDNLRKEAEDTKNSEK